MTNSEELNSAIEELNSMLVEAVLENNEQKAIESIKAGADVNYIERDDGGNRPVLFDAIREGNVKMVKLLLERGANPNCEAVSDDGNKHSALCISILSECPNDEITEALIEAGADVNYIGRDDDGKYPILTVAIRQGNVKRVKLLLERGANPNCETEIANRAKASALHHSINDFPNDEITEALIEAGADVNYISRCDKLNCPILIGAIIKGNVKMVKLLLEKGANPNCEIVFDDGKIVSALSASILQWPNDEIAKALIEAGADVNYISTRCDKCNCPILIDAIINGNVKMVKLLLEKGANPNCEEVCDDGNKFSALDISISMRPNDEIAEALIEAGADVNYIERDDKLNCPILIDAIIKGNVKMVKLLLEKGANPNCESEHVNGTKFSALYGSIVGWPNDEITRLLAENMTTKPFDISNKYARRKFSPETRKALEKIGVKFSLL